MTPRESLDAGDRLRCPVPRRKRPVLRRSRSGVCYEVTRARRAEIVPDCDQTVPVTSLPILTEPHGSHRPPFRM
jgi:hypothetical protein